MLATLANHLWQSTLFVIIAALLALALRKNGARIRYWLWMAASLKFFVPFSMLVAFGSQFAWRAEPSSREGFAMPERWADFAGNVVQPVERYVGTPAIQTNVANFNSIWSVEFIVLLVWAAGFFGVAGFWLVRWLKVKALLVRAQPLASDTVPELREFPVPVKSAAAAIEPGIVGIVRPVLLLPQGLFERLTRRQLQAILAHERCHLQRRDNLTAAIHMLVEAIFWFHPLVWWIGARLVEERERACDAAVLNAGNDPETYAEGILDVCQHYVAAPVDCMAGVSGADLKKRVRSIMTFQGEARLHFMKMALLASVTLIVVASPVLVGALTASRADAQISTQTLYGDTSPENWPTITSTSIAIGQEPTNGMGKSLLTNPNGMFTTRNWSLRGVIAYAYGIQDSEIFEPNAELNDIASTRYNILALSPDIETADLAGQKQFKLMVRRLLAEKFKLQFHWEDRRAPVYVMTVSAPNSGLKVAQRDDPGPGQSLGVNSVSGHATPLILLKQFLSNKLRRPIVDQTGLTGSYNYKLKWGPEPGDPGVSSSPETIVAINNPTPDALIDAMQNQLGLTLTSQDGNVRRMVVDRLEQPLDLIPKPVEVQLDPQILDRYVGYYDYPQSRIMSVTRSGQQLFAQLTGQPPIEIFATGEREFFAKAIDGRATFNVDNQGRATELVLLQHGREAHARRLDDTVAKLRIESLALRIRDKVPSSGTEVALRAHLEGMQNGEPPYHLMTPEVFYAVKTGWAEAKVRYAKLGLLYSIEFKSVDPSGADVYVAKFQNGSSEWRVHLNEAGKMDILNYRRLPTP